MIGFMVDTFYTINRSGIYNERIILYGNQSGIGDVDGHIGITQRYLDDHDAFLEAAHDLQSRIGWLSQWLANQYLGQIDS